MPREIFAFGNENNLLPCSAPAAVLSRLAGSADLGPFLDRFVQWLHDQRYAVGTISNYVEALPPVVQRLKRRRITSLHQVTHQDLDALSDYYQLSNSKITWGLSALQRFLREGKLISEGEPPPPSRVVMEVDRFATQLREVRGLAPVTVTRHTNQIRSFLDYLRFKQIPVQSVL